MLISGVVNAPGPPLCTHSFANPALRTAVEIALMAVRSELRRRVRLPVAPSTRRCSLSTKRVSVMESTSISPVTVAMSITRQGDRSSEQREIRSTQERDLAGLLPLVARAAARLPPPEAILMDFSTNNNNN